MTKSQNSSPETQDKFVKLRQEQAAHFEELSKKLANSDLKMYEFCRKYKVEETIFRRWRRLQKYDKDGTYINKYKSGEIGLNAAEKAAVAAYEGPIATNAKEIFNKLPKKHQKILNDHVKELLKQMEEKHEKDSIEAKKQARKLKLEANKIRDDARHMLRNFHTTLSEKDYKLIIGMLHPDKHPGNEERAKKAFELMRKFGHFLQLKKEA